MEEFTGRPPLNNDTRDEAMGKMEGGQEALDELAKKPRTLLDVIEIDDTDLAMQLQRYKNETERLKEIIMAASRRILEATEQIKKEIL